MYKVMIVEDEIPIRNIISRIIDWEQLGYKLVHEADNGQMALEYLEENPVDLVITDISMPFMDGLELSRQIRKSHLNMTIIILTGYNEFDYAQQAIDLNVSNYLLKPITKDSFTETLGKIKIEMDQRFADKKNLEFLRKQYEKSKELMIDKYLMNLILGYSQPDFSMSEMEMGINLEANYYRVGVMTIKDGRESEKEFWGEDRPLLEFAIYNLTEELLARVDQDIIFFGPGNQICMIFKGKSEDQSEELNELITGLTDITLQIDNLFHMDATIGLSDAYYETGELSYAYQDAITALEYQVLEGSGKVILKTDVENKSSFAFNKFDKQIVRMENLIKVGDKENLQKVIDYIFSMIHHEKIDIEDFRTMLLKITITILKAYNDIRQVDDGEQDMDYTIFSQVFEMNDFDDIKDYYIELCETLSGRIKEIRRNEEQGYVNSAIKYMEENYSDPYLNLESLCKTLFLSPGHFSRLFKQTTGETFVDYLTRLRMDQAKYLLANTSRKMYEIARAVGYEDPNYFSYNFKKHVKSTPSEWRRKGRG
ncbi:two-component system, response regulator YesN [Dethiosulfatibacter aminovorans DSM 17477]|uniref:Two-component system, response regulator YesN n=1 Tax=Dethiosulfatibacter aminovorans DSM 17477 TaxID=1121476 RepID=A0A1M6L2K5_9FIRM|nr:response regulator [Dethiosulfatibacter aminovorans]SHJ65403.1 two-component system, response regulator YesN [Dethiosulfatibacter aminovorans DSM 17477]